jgi:hypothetical protein
MQPTSLKKALDFASEHYGLKVSLNRDKLLEKVNMVRHSYWKNEATRDLCFRASGCACIEVNSIACNAGKATDYYGITLPHGVTSLQHLTVAGQRIDITESSIGVGVGCGTRCHGKVEAEVQTMRAPLAKSVPNDYVGPVIIKTMDSADKSARVGMEYITPSGKMIREDILATSAGPETTSPCVRVISAVMSERVGYIKFLTVDGWELGSYHPSILVPRHLRVHINGLPAGTVVEWQGFKEPQDARFDTDEVEIGGKVDWINAFNWLDAHLKPTKNRDDLTQLQVTSGYAQAGAEQELRATHHRPLKGLAPKSIRRLSRRINSFH